MATAINSVEVRIAQVVITSIPVLSAMALINQKIVIFVPQAKPPNPSSLSPLLPTPIKNWLYNQLVSGFNHGFSLHFDGSKVPCSYNNLLSADQNLSAVEDKLSKELALGRLAGPYSSPPFSNFCISPLGVVPKKTPGEFRLIHHPSFPKGLSINDGIPEEFSSVSYATIQDAIKKIKLAGRGCHLAKTNVKNAFWIIPISPKDYHLLGMAFSISINACQWAVLVLVRPSSFLARL